MTKQTREADEAAFRRSIDVFTLSQIKAGVVEFAELLLRLPSIYPTEVVASLQRLAQSGRISAEVSARICREAGRRPAFPPEGRSLLPLPHPLDYEWRFTADASRSLLDLASDLTPAGADVLLFGTPGLASEALALPIDRRVSLLAEDNVVTRRLITLNRATGSPLSIAFCRAGLPRESADAVLLDPPWYMDFIRPMLAAAAAACRQGGVALVSMPPDSTRPNAREQQLAALRFAGRLGLDLIEHQPLALSYDTPFFEANALAAAGVYPRPRWRRGDLLVLRKAREGARVLPRSSGRRRDWLEVTVGRMRLSVRIAANGGSGLTGLVPLLDNDVLPSVSRRHPGRRNAQVWTSGNRIFCTDNPQLLLEAALLHTGEAESSSLQPGLWGNLSYHQALERTARQLAELAELEAAEERGSAWTVPERGTIWKSNSTSYWTRSPAMAFG